MTHTHPHTADLRAAHQAVADANAAQAAAIDQRVAAVRAADRAAKLTVRQLAELLGCSEWTAQDLLRRARTGRSRKAATPAPADTAV